MLKEIQFVQRVLIEQCSLITAWLPEHNPAVHYVVALCLSSLDL
jgi:hypothetical protein